MYCVCLTSSISRDNFLVKKTKSRFTLDRLYTCHILIRDNYPSFVMTSNNMYSLGLLICLMCVTDYICNNYVQTNLYLF